MPRQDFHLQDRATFARRTIMMMWLRWGQGCGEAHPCGGEVAHRLGLIQGPVLSTHTQWTRMTFPQSSFLPGVSLLFLSAFIPVSGQETARGGFQDGGVKALNAAPQESDRSWWSLWSVSSTYDRVYLGMWTFHPFGDDPFRFETNNGLGLQYRSLFAFTCANSFDQRTYVAGAERVWFEAQRGSLAVMLGFRLGLIRGYDTELLQIAGETPVLPFAGTVALVRLGPVGGEVSWVYRAVSLVGAVFF